MGFKVGRVEFSDFGAADRFTEAVVGLENGRVVLTQVVAVLLGRVNVSPGQVGAHEEAYLEVDYRSEESGGGRTRLDAFIRLAEFAILALVLGFMFKVSD